MVLLGQWPRNSQAGREDQCVAEEARHGSVCPHPRATNHMHDWPSHITSVTLLSSTVAKHSPAGLKGY